jgi:hypothetical protein
MYVPIAAYACYRMFFEPRKKPDPKSISTRLARLSNIPRVEKPPTLR